jgi:hypothetical protein
MPHRATFGTDGAWSRECPPDIALFRASIRPLSAAKVEFTAQ